MPRRRELPLAKDRAVLSGKLLIKDRLTCEGRWAQKTDHNGIGLVGKTLGSIGIGNIGAELFRLAKPWDMNFIAHDPYVDAAAAEQLGVRLVDDFETLFREADIVCVNCPLSDATRHLVNAERLALERVRHRQNQKGDSQGSQKVIQAMSWVKGGQPWMTRPYSEDLRERVVRVVESGTSRNAAAKQFDVSISFVVKLMQRWKQRGTIKADKYGGWKKSKLAPHGDRIRALVMENCDITIDELCVLLAAEGIEAKRSTLGDFLLAQGLSRKKRQPTPPSRSALTSRRREPLGATSNLG